MKRRIKRIVLLLLISAGPFAYGQINMKAYNKAENASKLEEAGKIDEAIVLLEEAKKLEPDNLNYQFEYGNAWFLKNDFNTGIKYLQPMVNDSNAFFKVFQVLGKCYNNVENTDKALETYVAGLKKYPLAGEFYTETGNIWVKKKDYLKALYYYELGIKIVPGYPSNYYWAAKLFCGSNESVWGMIYGEIFMNLESSSERTFEISKLLYDTYKSEIKIKGHDSVFVSFSKNSVISTDEKKDSSKLKIPFGVDIYEHTLLYSIRSVKIINIISLDIIRTRFIDIYFNQGYDKTYPNVLFSYQKQVKDAGHLEAYNHYILIAGDEDEFKKWQSTNKDKWDNFVKWFRENKMETDYDYKFYRAQY